MSYQNIYSMILTLNKNFHNHEMLGDTTHISYYSEYTPLILLCKNMTQYFYFSKVPKCLLNEIKRRYDIKKLSEDLLIAKEKLLKFSGETYVSRNRIDGTRIILKRGGSFKYLSDRIKNGGAKGKRKKMQKKMQKKKEKELKEEFNLKKESMIRGIESLEYNIRIKSMLVPLESPTRYEGRRQVEMVSIMQGEWFNKDHDDGILYKYLSTIIKELYFDMLVYVLTEMNNELNTDMINYKSYGIKNKPDTDPALLVGPIDNPTFTEIMVTNGADANITDNDNMNALSYVSILKSVNLLLSYGANPYIKSIEGTTIFDENHKFKFHGYGQNWAEEIPNKIRKRVDTFNTKKTLEFTKGITDKFGEGSVLDMGYEIDPYIFQTISTHLKNKKKISRKRSRKRSKKKYYYK